jgi:hypothetical protein
LLESPESARPRASFLEEAQVAIESRLPLLKRLMLSDQAGVAPARLPPITGLVATILDCTDRPCCLVVPDHHGVALAVGTLVAVSQLQRAVPEILRAYANISFQAGPEKEAARVLVHPSGLVYEYSGFFCPEQFKLKVVGRNEWRSLPVHEVARLERTSRKMPKGYGNSDLGRPQPTVLGTLIGIPGTVNRNFLRNYVAVLGSKKLLRDQLQSWIIALADAAGLSGALGTEIPFGEVDEDGALSFFDTYIASGEPPVAVASSPDHLAAFCAARPQFTAAVIVDDIERLARSLQSYDRIADRQRVVVLADDSQHEAVDILRERGCIVWHLSPEEVLVGAADKPDAGLLKSLLAKASNMRDLVVASSPCGDALLDEAAAELSGAARAIPADNDNSSVRDLFLTLFGTLMLCAEYLGSAGDTFLGDIKNRLNQAEALLRRAGMWIAPGLSAELRAVITKLNRAATELSEDTVSPKGQVLLDSLVRGSTSGLPTAVVTRSEARRGAVQKWLADQGHQIPVYRVTEVPTDRQFEQLFVVSWPSARRFDRLLRLYTTQKLQVLAYSFERMWLKDYSNRYARVARTELTTKRKASLLGLPQAADMPEDSQPAAPVADGRGLFDIPEERFLIRRKSVAATTVSGTGAPEELMDAYYVDFAGPTFAYITESHDLPVVNDYVTDGKSAVAKVPFRSIEDLKVGDFILFRGTGDSDIIRFMVEDEIGVEAYRKLRTLATRWKVSLRRIGSDPAAVWEKLRQFAFSRHPQTVRSWLVDQQKIAPKNISDIRTIALASDDQELLNMLPSVEIAISEINGHHIRAGKRLTSELLKELPKRLDVLAAGETEIDLGFGKVWIVRVEEIDEATSQVNYTLVNRLLWDSNYTLHEIS